MAGRRSRRTGKRPLQPVAQRWAWFRVAALAACLSRPRMTGALCEFLEVPGSSGYRTAQRNLAGMVRRGWMIRGEDGYRTTARGRQLHDNLEEIDLAEAG